MELTFSGEVWFWRGPSPFHFVTVPAIVATEIKDVANRVTYGWGMIPVTATVATTTWTTSLFPKDGLYLVPLKAKIRDAHDIAIGDVLEIALRIGN